MPSSGMPSSPPVPAPALPTWPEPTNPTAPGNRAARPEPARPEPARTEPAPPDAHPQDQWSAGRRDGPPAYTVPPPQQNSPQVRPPGAPSSVDPPNSPPAAASPEYHQWARNQRPTGTMYGSRGTFSGGPLTAAMPGASSLENSGSLTGHILAQGYADAPGQRGRTTKVVVIGLVMLALLVAIGLLAATAAGDAITDFFNSVIKT